MTLHMTGQGPEHKDISSRIGNAQEVQAMHDALWNLVQGGGYEQS